MGNKLTAITRTQLKAFNATRPFVLRCSMLGHKFGPVRKPLPIRINGGIKRFECEGCIRCGFTKTLDAV